jgi:hypothetical protein
LHSGSGNLLADRRTLQTGGDLLIPVLPYPLASTLAQAIVTFLSSYHKPALWEEATCLFHDVFTRTISRTTFAIIIMTTDVMIISDKKAEV